MWKCLTKPNLLLHCTIVGQCTLYTQKAQQFQNISALRPFANCCCYHTNKVSKFCDFNKFMWEIVIIIQKGSSWPVHNIHFDKLL